MPASIVVRLVAAAALVWTSFALLISTGDRRPQRLTIVPARAFVVPAVRRIRRLLVRQSLLAMTISSAIALDAGAEPDVHTLQLIARQQWNRRRAMSRDGPSPHLSVASSATCLDPTC